MAASLLDDREEGEIVDDDFEDISDNSIGPLDECCGKSVSAKGVLPPLCLSNISESDEPAERLPPKRPRRRSFRKRKSRLPKAFPHAVVSDSDEGRDDHRLSLDPKLKKQLKAAVRVENSDSHHNNSLRSRLKGMAQKGNNTTTTSPDEERDDNKCVSENNIDSNDKDDMDSELIKLRLEALKTAFLNKSKCRKKRKVGVLQENGNNIVDSDNKIIDSNVDVDKLIVISDEDVDINENPKKKHCPDNNDDANDLLDNSQEDDEDVLRAILLASMSKKIVKETPLDKNIIVNAQPNLQATTNIKENVIADNNKSKFYKNLMHTHSLQLPKIKPILININGDSDTDDDSNTFRIENSTKQTSNSGGIESTVQKFLNQERAKVEAQNNIVTTSTVLTPKHTNVVNKSELEKSSVKLLPKEQQIEYRKLLMKLKNAEKRKVRRVSHRTNIQKSPGVIPAVIKTSTKKIVNHRVLINKPTDIKMKKLDANTAPPTDITNELKLLRRTFKEMQVDKNGKLHIQQKYLSLTGIIKKINEVSAERQKYNREIKRILEELTETKKKLQQSHQSFVNHINELVKKKQAIDKADITTTLPASAKVVVPVKKIAPVNDAKTSVKDSVDDGVIAETASIKPLEDDNNKELQDNVECNGKDEPDNQDKGTKDTDDTEFGEENVMIDNNESIVTTAGLAEPQIINDTSKVATSSSNVDKQISIDTTDNSAMTNTIEDDTSVIIVDDNHEEDVKNNDRLKYISPLVTTNNRSNNYVDIDDPFAILCPYDVDGNCCDPECIFKHYKRSS